MTARTARQPAATVYARGPFAAGGVVILEEEEAHHLRVRRIGDGDTIRLVDGRGGVATARLGVDRDVVAARVVATTSVAAPPATDLLVGAGDRDRFIALAEKATELGATRLVPLLAERALQVSPRFQAAQVEKATRRAREALKQCGAAWAPVVLSPLTLAEALRVAGPAAHRLLADPHGDAFPGVAEGDSVQWAVGPEGGFTEPELELLKGAGFAPVALGRATLRFDTAAVSALAITAASRVTHTATEV
jgi:16S rRNA (uracil1498-N3)-methyltransferase